MGRYSLVGEIHLGLIWFGAFGSVFFCCGVFGGCLGDGQNRRSALVGVSWGLVVLLGSWVDKAPPGFNGSPQRRPTQTSKSSIKYSLAHADVDGTRITQGEDGVPGDMWHTQCHQRHSIVVFCPPYLLIHWNDLSFIGYLFLATTSSLGWFFVPPLVWISSISLQFALPLHQLVSCLWMLEQVLDFRQTIIWFFFASLVGCFLVPSQLDLSDFIS